MGNRIEQIIANIENYLEGCKGQAFSANKIIIDRFQIQEMLDELKQHTPEEIRKYQRIVDNRDKILETAKRQADDLQKKAMEYRERLINENQITQGAYKRSNEILEQANAQAEEILAAANEEARQIRDGAYEYTNSLLDDLRQILSGTIEDFRIKFDDTDKTLQNHLNIVEQNIADLNGTEVETKETKNPNSQSFFESEENPNGNGFFSAN